MTKKKENPATEIAQTLANGPSVSEGMLRRLGDYKPDGALDPSCPIEAIVAQQVDSEIQNLHRLTDAALHTFGALRGFTDRLQQQRQRLDEIFAALRKRNARR
jgi:hypothetical protein